MLDYKLNSKAKQENFSNKIKIYKDASLIITRDLGQNIDQWNVDLIDKRCEWLAECFNSIWTIDGSSAPVEEFSKWLNK